MGVSMTARPIIRPATSADLSQIERWLRAEYEVEHEGFYCNWRIIAEALDEGFLTVLMVGEDPVAFLAEEASGPLILDVRIDQRAKGFGRLLAQHMIDSWRERGVNVLDIECAPQSSFGFWRKMGFQRLGDQGTWPDDMAPRAYLLFERRFELPPGPRTPFEISFYRAQDWHADADPFRVYRGDGAITADGHWLQLPERVVCFDDRIEFSGLPDCFARVTVAGVDLFHGERAGEKVKYDEAADIGFERADAGAREFYVDRLRLRS